MGDCCEPAELGCHKCKKMAAPLWWLRCLFSGMVWRIKMFIRRRRKSAMQLWVEHEIKIAIDREHAADKADCEKQGKKYNPKEFSYGGAIYESALRAFKSLLKDGHSGMSWAFTTSVLNRMMQHKVLTPLQGTDDEWCECKIKNMDGVQDFQNVRQSSLFKHVDPDGSVRYSDIDRVVCVDQDDPRDVHHFGLSSKVVDEFFPLTFPYMPTDEPYKVIDKIFSSDGKPGEFDTVGVIKVVTPEGEEKLVGRYYKEDGDTFVEITKAEFDLRLESYKEKCSVKNHPDNL